MRNGLFFIISALFLNCAAPLSDSRVKIAHGTTISEDVHPAVVEIEGRPNGGYVSACTATFVGPNTVLTAAHCIRNGTIYYKGQAPKQGGAISSRDYANSQVARYDLGIIVYENDIAPAYLPISTRAPREDEEYLLVGYGNNTISGFQNGVGVGGGGSGIKRQATGKQYLSIAETIEIYGDLALQSRPGELQPTALNGDSGGPLIVNNTVVGTVSGGVTQVIQGRRQELNRYTNLNSTSSQRFIKAVLDDANLGAKIEFASPDGATNFPRQETMNLALIMTGGNQALLQMSAQTSKGIGKIIFCFQEASACARDFFSTDKKLFYSELTKTGVKSSFDIFSSPAMNLTQAAYTITSIAVDVSGKVINSRSFLLSR